MIFATLLASTPLLSKPSDILGMAISGSIFLFVLWVCVRAAGSFDRFMKGLAWVIVLAIVAMALIAIFQAGHPGQ